MTSNHKIVLFNLSAVICTYVQVLWSAPEGVSAADMSNSPIAYLHWYALISLIFLNCLLLMLKRKSILSKVILSTLVLVIFWLLMNYMEFNDRVASWSTFSVMGIWIHVLLNSILTIAVCGAAFFIINRNILQRT
ncbi:hypothetical protein SAMN05421820_105409 [Pedobacter steynii]|uniref:Uncharacterized protein n=1 Tax=Pedobacter steynii TaxID=430522 RepID=A0A1G9X8I2_9SPHI|nr:hypothetical protein [Pedobacter steynii]NQX40516.1 hypothetical protein [Pedobacter steynii]SDM93092.1 hypothetical protein SAMN05421820_105409 [Pedobacter steynii]